MTTTEEEWLFSPMTAWALNCRSKKGKRLDEIASLSSTTSESSDSPTPSAPSVPSPDSPSLLEKAKNFYKEADALAAQNALLLNKELEERGVLEKITDKSGLKVVGKREKKGGDNKGNDKDS